MEISSNEKSSLTLLWEQFWDFRNDFRAHDTKDDARFEKVNDRITALEIRLAVVCALSSVAGSILANVPWSKLFAH